MTILRSSCRPSQSARISRIAVLLLAASCLSPRVWAKDAAPQWLRDAANGAVPSHEEDAVAVILLDDTETTVRDNGEIQTLHRRAFRILRPEARDRFGEISVPFDSDTKISSLHAWTIAPGGQEIAVSEKDAVEHGFLDDLEYTDEKVKTLHFPEANPGSVVGYEYSQRDRPYAFEDSWDFQRSVPVKESRFDLKLPPGWEFSAKWFNHSEQAPQNPAPNEWIWETTEVPALRSEKNMPPVQAVAGWVGIKYFPRDPALRAKSAGTWSDIGVWYNGLTLSRRDSSPAIHQKVTELTSALAEPLAKIQALGSYVQHNIHYFAVEIGIGGLQPHPAAQIFAHQFGDCKDKATLLSAMLKEIGVDSYYVAVDDFRDGVQPDYPSISFNHVILAIRLPDNINDVALYSVVHDPKLGKLLIFDPTNEYVPVGYLPYYLQSTYGLVMGPEGGALVALPVLPPATNRLMRTGQFSLTSSGVLSGAVREVRWGDPAQEGRQEYLEIQPSKRVERLESFLQQSLPNFGLRSASLGDLEKYENPLTIDYNFVSSGYARNAGDEIFFRPLVLANDDVDLIELFSQNKPRQYPVEFDAASRHYDAFDISLPAGYVVDGASAPVKISCDAAAYTSSIEVKDGVLRYTRTFEIRQVHVPAEKLSELKEFLQKVAADQQMYVALRPAPAQPLASR